MKAMLLTTISVVLASLAGCGPSMAQVEGRVTCNGEPVTEGTIHFSPVGGGTAESPGKPAAGKIQSDGSFKLTTRVKDDGAVPGKHRVSYSPPSVDRDESGDDRGPPPRPSKFAGCVTPKDYTVDLDPGLNEIEIKLKRRGFSRR